MNITRVFKLGLKEKEKLKNALSSSQFTWKKVAHAEFQIQRNGLSATLYKSGKLVVQGKEAELWIAEYLGESVKPEPPKDEKPKDENWPSPDQSIGSDEAGKGDSFGGIAVCAVGLSSDTYKEVAETNICDSKKMSDSLILQLAPWLKSRIAYKEIELSPFEYNEMWRQCGGNVNNLLTELHTKCIHALLKKDIYKSIVIDRFSPQLPVTKKLNKIKSNIVVVEKPRGEEFLAVACASVIARAAFLNQIKRMSEELAMDVPLGSGSPIPKALKRYQDIHGNNDWEKAVKIHFKNIQQFIS